MSDSDSSKRDTRYDHSRYSTHLWDKPIDEQADASDDELAQADEGVAVVDAEVDAAEVAGAHPKEHESDDHAEKPSQAAITLKFKSMQDAEEHLSAANRTMLEAIEDDDVDTVRDARGDWALKIKTAFYATYKNTAQVPEKHKAGSQVSWVKWQQDALDKATTLRPSDADIEVIAWRLVEEVIEVHVAGFRGVQKSRMDKKDNEKLSESDRALKCSERLTAVAKAIAGYPHVRIELFKGGQVHELAAVPNAIVNSKISNFVGNRLNRGPALKEAQKFKKEVKKKQAKKDLEDEDEWNGFSDEEIHREGARE